MKNLSLHGYWCVHLQGKMAYKTFQKEIKILLSDPEVREKFGAYRGQRLTARQVEILQEENFIK